MKLALAKLAALAAILLAIAGPAAAQYDPYRDPANPLYNPNHVARHASMTAPARAAHHPGRHVRHGRASHGRSHHGHAASRRHHGHGATRHHHASAHHVARHGHPGRHRHGAASHHKAPVHHHHHHHRR
jgi:hypothetical protein